MSPDNDAPRPPRRQARRTRTGNRGSCSARRRVARSEDRRRGWFLPSIRHRSPAPRGGRARSTVFTRRGPGTRRCARRCRARSKAEGLRQSHTVRVSCPPRRRRALGALPQTAYCHSRTRDGCFSVFRATQTPTPRVVLIRRLSANVSRAHSCSGFCSRSLLFTRAERARVGSPGTRAPHLCRVQDEPLKAW
jgi:hypothetical protein